MFCTTWLRYKSQRLRLACPIPLFWNAAYSAAYTHRDNSQNDNIKMVSFRGQPDSQPLPQRCWLIFISVSCDQGTQQTATCRGVILQSLPQVYLKFDSVLLNLISAEGRKDEEGERGRGRARQGNLHKDHDHGDCCHRLSAVTSFNAELFAFLNDRCTGSSSPPPSCPPEEPALCGTPAAPSLLKATIPLKYHLNKHQLTLISPTFDADWDQDENELFWSWSKAHISHFNLI